MPPRDPDAALLRFQAYLKRLASGELKRSTEQLKADLAVKLEARVREVYRSYRDKYPTGFARKSITRGKEGGAERLAREPRSLAPSTMEMLARAVMKEREGAGWTIRINPMAFLPEPRGIGKSNFFMGVPLSLVARWLENPAPYLMPVTHRMRAYQIMLRERRGGFGTRKVRRHIPNFPTGKMIVVRPPDRPVWRKVAEEAQLVKQTLQSRWGELMGKLAVGYGGKVI